MRPWIPLQQTRRPRNVAKILGCLCPERLSQTGLLGKPIWVGIFDRPGHTSVGGGCGCAATAAPTWCGGGRGGRPGRLTETAERARPSRDVAAPKGARSAGQPGSVRPLRGRSAREVTARARESLPMSRSAGSRRPPPSSRSCGTARSASIAPASASPSARTGWPAVEPHLLRSRRRGRTFLAHCTHQIAMDGPSLRAARAPSSPKGKRRTNESAASRG
jgi:hypothetical protein